MAEKVKEMKDIVSERHISYDANIAAWTLRGDAVNGEGGFANGSYVQKYKSESDDKYKDRKDIAYYLNHTAPVIEAYVGHLFKKPAVRQYDDNAELARFYESTNIKGDKKIDELMKEVSAFSMTYGHCFVVVDRPNTPEDAVTKEQQEALGIETYAYVISPKQLINWGIGPDGMLSFGVIQETYISNELIWNAPHKEMLRYRVWTLDEWFLYEHGQNEPVEFGKHDLGVVPIIPVTNVMIEGRAVIGRSDIAEIATINKTLFNDCSKLDELILNNALSLLVMSKKNLKPDADGNINITLGADRILTYEETPPQYISPAPHAIQALETRIDKSIDNIYRIAKLDFSSGISSSGIALAFKFEKTNEVLARKAGVLEDAERKIANLVLLWSSDEASNKGVEVSIEYPRDFGIVDMIAEATKDQAVLDLDISATFNEMYKKKIARKFMPNLLDETLIIIDGEIEEEAAAEEFPGEEEVNKEDPENGEEETN